MRAHEPANSKEGGARGAGSKGSAFNALAFITKKLIVLKQSFFIREGLSGITEI